ncbi:hypothetical protein M405DRAFT_883909 [Rhizopogon salebrosus TDB-379]|nr:hypothetical protein M405DRAFT_883909 [Rhizopogon salebrosus TDB-379]
MTRVQRRGRGGGSLQAETCTAQIQSNKADTWTQRAEAAVPKRRHAQPTDGDKAKEAAVSKRRHAQPKPRATKWIRGRTEQRRQSPSGDMHSPNPEQQSGYVDARSRGGSPQAETCTAQTQSNKMETWTQRAETAVPKRRHAQPREKAEKAKAAETRGEDGSPRPYEKKSEACTAQREKAEEEAAVPTLQPARAQRTGCRRRPKAEGILGRSTKYGRKVKGNVYDLVKEEESTFRRMCKPFNIGVGDCLVQKVFAQ